MTSTGAARACRKAITLTREDYDLAMPPHAEPGQVASQAGYPAALALALAAAATAAGLLIFVVKLLRKTG